jgi:hypothetical protein
MVEATVAAGEDTAAPEEVPEEVPEEEEEDPSTSPIVVVSGEAEAGRRGGARG